MRSTAELPAFTPAGGTNLLMSIASLSNARYIEQAAPSRGMALNSFVIGLVVGALAAVAVMLS